MAVTLPLSSLLPLVMLGVATLASFSLWQMQLDSGVPELWLANGAALSILTLRPIGEWRRLAVAIWLGQWLPQWGLSASLATSLGLASLNLLEIFFVALAVRRFGGDVLRPESLIPATRAVAVSGALAAALLGLPAALALSTEALVAGGVLSMWSEWFIAHLLGLVIAASLGSMALQLGVRLLGQAGRRRDYWTCQLLLVVSLLAVFAQNKYPLLFVPWLPLLLLSYRHGMPGASSGLFVLALGTAAAAAADGGAFKMLENAGSFERSVLLQIYLACACLMAIPVAVASADRRRLAAQVVRKEAHYRLLAEHTRDLVVRLGADGFNRYVSNSSTSLLGYAPEELVSPRWDLLHPDDMDNVATSVNALFKNGGQASALFRLRHRDGHWVWIEALAARVESETDSGFDLVYSGRDVSARVAAEQALAEQARTDPLTGLANRREFSERLDLAVTRALRHHLPVGLIAVDIDHFKDINDTHGHAAGDQALIEVAQRIRSSIGKLDLVARVGGDELMVLIEDIEDADYAKRIADRLLLCMREPMPLAGSMRVVGVSIGLAWSVAPDSMDTLLASADEALYLAKKEGRGTVRMFVAEAKPG